MAGGARHALFRPVRDRTAALSVVATIALAGMWSTRAAPHEDAARVAPRGAAPAPAVPAARDGAAEGFSGQVEFTATGLLAGVLGVGDGPVIPVLGVRPDDLRDSYGQPRDGERRHAGIDIGASRGTPVAAALDGWIVSLSSGAAGGRGLHLLDRTGTWLLYYGHLDGYSESVSAGLAVRRGELLGYVGATGNAGGWPHLHFEVGRTITAGSLATRPVNPYEFLLGLGSDR
jgi:peptidoglycan LD-endopeptidase LytH